MKKRNPKLVAEALTTYGSKTVHRWKYFKVTPKMLEFMRYLRSEFCLSYASIGEILRLDAETIRYHLSEKKQNAVKERARKQKHDYKSRSEYFRNYHRERYHSDSEYRERFKASVKRCYERHQVP